MTAEVPGWLEPYPDVLLDGLPAAPGPDARYGTSESVSLAFVAALQCLPPRQRAVLILRDVLGFPAAEVAGLLEVAEGWVSGTLRQARATLAARLPGAGREPAPPPRSARERKIASQFAGAFERADVPAILALLTDDVCLAMPPLPLAYQGLAATGQALSSQAFRAGRRYRLLATHANRQPAFGCYLADPRTPVLHAHGLLVLTLSGDRICALTRFTDNALLPRFGFPRLITELPAPRD
jgi:RNA polymerase sigma-70 factor (TIGR02960 family)